MRFFSRLRTHDVWPCWSDGNICSIDPDPTVRWQMWHEVTKMCKMATPKPCKRHAKWLLCAPSLAFKHTAAHILHTWTAFTCSILLAHWQHLTPHQSAAKFKICRFSLKFNLFLSAFPGFDRKSLGWKSLAGQEFHGNIRNITRTYERTQFGSLAIWHM